jgi:hypothetical protein
MSPSDLAAALSLFTLCCAALQENVTVSTVRKDRQPRPSCREDGHVTYGYAAVQGRRGGMEDCVTAQVGCRASVCSHIPHITRRGSEFYVKNITQFVRRRPSRNLCSCEVGSSEGFVCGRLCIVRVNRGFEQVWSSIGIDNLGVV